MTEQEYRNHTALANSDISLMLISPALLNAIKFEALELPDKKAYIFGNMFDKMILNPDEFNAEYILQQGTSPSSAQQQQFAELVSLGESPELAYAQTYSTKNKNESTILKAAIALYDSLSEWIEFLKTSDGRLTYTQEEANTLAAMELNLKSHPMANKLIFGTKDDWKCFNQKKIFWKMHGVECKAMLDRVIVDTKRKKVWLIDLKSTAFTFPIFKEKAREFGYIRQLNWYKSGIQHDPLFKDDWTIISVLVVCQKKGLNETRVFAINKDDMIKEEIDLVTNVDTYNWHIDNNIWDMTKEAHDNNGIEIL
jgi:hypothetical protein